MICGADRKCCHDAIFLLGWTNMAMTIIPVIYMYVLRVYVFVGVQVYGRLEKYIKNRIKGESINTEFFIKPSMRNILPSSSCIWKWREFADLHNAIQSNDGSNGRVLNNWGTRRSLEINIICKCAQESGACHGKLGSLVTTSPSLPNWNGHRDLMLQANSQCGAFLPMQRTLMLARIPEWPCQPILLSEGL